MLCKKADMRLRKGLSKGWDVFRAKFAAHTVFQNKILQKRTYFSVFSVTQVLFEFLGSGHNSVAKTSFYELSHRCNLWHETLFSKKEKNSKGEYVNAYDEL